MFVRTLKYEIALVCSWEKNKRKKEKLKLEVNLFLLFTILIFDIVRKMVSANEEGFEGKWFQQTKFLSKQTKKDLQKLALSLQQRYEKKKKFFK